MSSHDIKNPTGGVNMGRVMELPDPNNSLQFFKELWVNMHYPTTVRLTL